MTGAPSESCAATRPRCGDAPPATVPNQRPALSAREIAVLVGWLQAATKEEAAAALYIAPSTVSTHIARVRSKYAAVGRPARSKIALLARAVQDGYVSLGDL